MGEKIYGHGENKIWGNLAAKGLNYCADEGCLNLQIDDDDQSINDEPPIPPARKKVTKVTETY